MENKLIEDIKTDVAGIYSVINLMDKAKTYLSEESLAVLANQCKSNFVVKNGIHYKVLGLTRIVRKENIEKAIEEIAKSVNSFTEQGCVLGALAPISQLELGRSYMLDVAVAIYIFLLVSAEKREEIEKMTEEERQKLFICEEGFMPKDYDITLKTEPGEFFALIRQSHNMSRDFFQEQLDQYLKVLPKGTEVLSVRDLPISGLSLDREVRFFNPLMKQFKEVELEYVRMVEEVEGKIENYSLLTGVRYKTWDPEKDFQAKEKGG